jgi:uncharacterized membrane protein
MQYGRSMTGIGLGALGAGLAFFLDPQNGRRRRAMARDKAVRWSNVAACAADATIRDFRNRALGVAAETRALITASPASDDVVAERIRAELGRVVAHPAAVSVHVVDGCATLDGVVLRREHAGLLRRVRRVPGVQSVDTRLDIRERAGDEPALQGGSPRLVRPDIWQQHWSPTTRVLAGGAGLALAAAGARCRGLVGAAAGLTGALLLGRAATDLELKRLFGVGAGRRAVDLSKTIHVAAPVEAVYRFWRDFPSFPRFMTNVREVRDLGDGRSRWLVAGPAGATVEYDAELTRDVANELLAWKTLPGSAVDHAGLVRFDPAADGGTRVHVRLSYNPPGGALGHGIAALLGADPKGRMDGDLVRMKTLLETGKAARDAAQR